MFGLLEPGGMRMGKGGNGGYEGDNSPHEITPIVPSPPYLGGVTGHNASTTANSVTNSGRFIFSSATSPMSPASPTPTQGTNQPKLIIWIFMP